MVCVVASSASHGCSELVKVRSSVYSSHAEAGLAVSYGS
jgi:hypothetical protein